MQNIHSDPDAALTRRGFLFGSGMAAGGLILAPSWMGAASISPGLPTEVFRVIRDTDLLDLEFSFINFKIRGKHLESLGFGRSLVAVRFPPQHLAEAIFDQKEGGDQYEHAPLELNEHGNVSKPPIRSFLSGPSWLVFEVPDATRLRLDVDEWTEFLSGCQLKVPLNALSLTERKKIRAEAIEPSMPSAYETRLEIPFRLFISPGPKSYWRTTLCEAAALQRGQMARGIREIWHASLQSRVPVKPAGLPPGTTNLPPELQPPKRVGLHARAVYSPDYRRQGQPDFQLYYPAQAPLSLHALTRHRLVKQMNAGDGQIDAQHLILSSLGADASLYYASQKSVEQIIEEQLGPEGSNTGTELRLWKHRIVVGRDVFFAEAFFGFLFPFAFPAVYIEITQRKFVGRKIEKAQDPKDPDKVDDTPGAYLLKRRFIIVQDPVKQFNEAGGARGNSMPLKKVTLKTIQSPDLAPPKTRAVKEDDNGVNVGNLVFWPQLLTTDEKVAWEIECEDESGRKITTSEANFLFVDHIKAGNILYRSEPLEGSKASEPLTAVERTIPFPGVKCAFAPEQPRVVVRSRNVDQFIDWTVADDLRGLATGLAKEARNKLTEIIPQTVKFEVVRRELDQVIEDWKKNKVPEAAVEAKDRIAGELQKVIGDLERWSVTENERLHEYLDQALEQLEQAEKVAATLETHAMTFVSNFISDERKAGEALLKELESNADAQISDLKNKLDGLQDVALEVKARMKKELEHLEDAVKESLKDALPDLDPKPWLRSRAKEYSEGIAKGAQDAAANGSRYFHASMEKAQALIPALKGAAEVPIREIKQLEDYVVGGISQVRNGVYARLTEAVGKDGKLADDVRNGLAKPAAVVAGISRELGAVMAESEDKVKKIARKLEGFDLSQIKGIDLKDAIPDAKLFGKIPLRDILSEALRGQLPQVNAIELPDKLQKVWEWVAAVHKLDMGFLKFGIESTGDHPVQLYIKFNTEVILKPRPGKPKVQMTAWLGRFDKTTKSIFAVKGPEDSSFSITLLELIKVNFRQLQVTAEYELGSKVEPKVKPDLGKVEFLGPLKFVAKFQESLGNLGGGFRLNITPDHVTVSYSFPLPSVAFGAFGLSNILLGSRLSLPFADESLRFGFNVSTWEKPFALSVMGFAGRGFFRAAFESNGDRELAGALEFGGSLSFAVAVASGGLYVMAGAYFKINNSSTELSGYLRAGGNLDVIGLINIAVEFMLMVRYRKKGQESQLHGVCVVTVTIDLTFFSKDVEITMEKEIAGSSERGSGESRSLSFLKKTNEQALNPGLPVYGRTAAYFTRPAAGAHPFTTVRGRYGRKEWTKNYLNHFR